jgi:hypothetical protein
MTKMWDLPFKKSTVATGISLVLFGGAGVIVGAVLLQQYKAGILFKKSD